MKKSQGYQIPHFVRSDIFNSNLKVFIQALKYNIENFDAAKYIENLIENQY